MGLILKQIDWPRVNRKTRRQLKNRETYCPPISLFRWWARRPHALIGALLEASELSRGQLVADPFSGGGTVALEAAARGFRVYAQDLSPWAAWGLSTALDGVSPEKLKQAADMFIERLRPIARREYGARCLLHGECETIHCFWVREALCQSCDRSVFLYPYSLITLASRGDGEEWGFFGCSACGAVTRKRVGAGTNCRACGARLADPREPLLHKRVVECVHCGQEIPYTKAWSRRPCWHQVLVQRFCKASGRPVTHFDLPTKEERERRFRYSRIPRPLTEEIPDGRETGVLRRAGFTRWYELYPPRQLRALLRAVQIAGDLEVSDKVRKRIQLAIAGTAEMAGFLCRWDRFHPKAFEALANHHFSGLGLATETNLLGERGRGTIGRRLATSVAAATWARKHIGLTALDLQLVARSRRTVPRKARVLCGSSAVQKLPDSSARLIITDPPYYDAIQYGELATLFLRWAEVATAERSVWHPNLKAEAVPNQKRGTGPEDYERLLREIFRETARTLAPQGRLILTYHSTDFRGWAALGSALSEAGFRVVALGVGHSENETDHAKRDRLGFTKDLMLECVKSRREAANPAIVTGIRSSEERELIAAGRAVASLGGRGSREMAEAFLKATPRLRHRRITVPQSLTEQNNGS